MLCNFRPCSPDWLISGKRSERLFHQLTPPARRSPLNMRLRDLWNNERDTVHKTQQFTTKGARTVTGPKSLKEKKNKKKQETGKRV